ncbi:MAG: alpha/beta hydrolase [Thermoplasmata archaeon]|nr:alpha/beta hydrolase [Thermoplasmata archaeon]
MRTERRQEHGFVRVASGHRFEFVSRGSGRDTLLIHPGGPGMSYPYLANLLLLGNRRRRVLLFNPRGVGRSWTPRHRSAYTVANSAADVEELRRALHLERFDLLGFSAGGFVALEYARRHPGRLRSLLLCATAASASDIDESNQRMLAAAPKPTRQRLRELTRSKSFDDPEYVRLAAEVGVPFSRRFLPRDPPSVRRSVVNPDVYRAMMTPSGDEFAVEGSLAGWDRRPDLQRLALPVLVLVGRHDFFYDASRTMAARIRGARLVVLSRASHLAHLEQPAAFRSAIRGFLGDLSTAVAR